MAKKWKQHAQSHPANEALRLIKENNVSSSLILTMYEVKNSLYT